MIGALLGQKIDQTQKFLEDGRRVPVTIIAVPDNAVAQVKTTEKEQYNAVQIGVSTKKKAIKSIAGHSKKAGLKDTPALLREVRVDGAMPAAGEMISVVSVFQPGDIVKVTGTSKGKGFAGVVKRHHFRGGPKTHGQSDRQRAPGSIGQTTTPGRVYRGKRMAGHMGVDVATVKNLTVVGVDDVNKVLLVLGLVPGHKNSFLMITKTGEQKKFVPLLQTEAQQQEEAPQSVEVVSTEGSDEPKEASVVEEVASEAPAEEVVEQKAEAAPAESSSEPKEATKEAEGQTEVTETKEEISK